MLRIEGWLVVEIAHLGLKFVAQKVIIKILCLDTANSDQVGSNITCHAVVCPSPQQECRKWKKLLV